MLGCEANCGRAPGKAGISGDHRSRFGAHRRRRRGLYRLERPQRPGAHSDVKLLKGRLPASRGARNRAGLWSLGLIVLTLLALSALIRG
jgi:hypothetical protein